VAPRLVPGLDDRAALIGVEKQAPPAINNEFNNVRTSVRTSGMKSAMKSAMKSEMERVVKSGMGVT
jgi:hypothetical protein